VKLGIVSKLIKSEQNSVIRFSQNGIFSTVHNNYNLDILIVQIKESPVIAHNLNILIESILFEFFYQ
jgi:hypothetical protein